MGKKSQTILLIGFIIVVVFTISLSISNLTQINKKSQNNNKVIRGTLEYWFYKPRVQKEIKRLNQGGYVISAEGNNLIYTIKIHAEKNDIDIEELEIKVISQDKAFKFIGNTLRESSKIDNLLITMKYIDKNDQEIYRYETFCK